MNHFSNADQPFASATVTPPVHVCEELLTLHGIDFHDNPLVIKISKIHLNNQSTIFNLHYTPHQPSE